MTAPESTVESDTLAAELSFSLEQFNLGAGVFSVERSRGALLIRGLRKIVHLGKTDFHRVLIADSINYGRVISLDGVLQSAESDEELCYELFVQPAMVLHPNPRRILVLGGANGACLRELVRHKSVESVRMVCPDSKLIQINREYLQSWHRGAFDDPRLNLLGTNCREFVENESSKYDLVFLDLADLDDIRAGRLHTREFYGLLKTCLAPGGIVILRGMDFSSCQQEKFFMLARTLRSVFSELHSYHAFIESFASDRAFLIASDWCNPERISSRFIDDSLSSRLGANGLKHMDGEFFLSTLRFPKFVRSSLKESGPIMQDFD